MVNQLEPSPHGLRARVSAKGGVLLAVGGPSSPPWSFRLVSKLWIWTWVDMVASGEDVEEEQQWIPQLVVGGQ